MKRKIILPIVVVGALVAAGLFAAVFTPGTVSAAAPAASAYRALAGDGPQRSGNDTYLAEALGITTEELSAAYQKASAAAIDKALAAGTITQEQADALKARGFGLGRHGLRLGSDVDFDALLADALGISTEKPNAAYAKAFEARIAAAVAAGDITAQQADLMRGRYALYNDSGFQSTMRSAFESAVNKAVESGLITQSQADQILASDLPQFGGHGMRGFGGFEGFGGFGGRGMHGGNRDRGIPPTDSTPTTPSGSNG